MFPRIMVAVIILTVIGTTATSAQAQSAHPWRTCHQYATRLIGGLEYHNDPYGTGQRSCITVTQGELRIGTDYRPSGGSVVAYDSAEFGAYPYSRDLLAGLPGPVRSVHPVVRVRMGSAPGIWLGDLDVWLGRPGPRVSHVREIIIANRWSGYGRYCDPFRVRVGARMLWRLPPTRLHVVAGRAFYAGACMTGGSGHAHLLIRFLAARQSAGLRAGLRAFLLFALRHRWIGRGMVVESVSYGAECWSGCEGLTYSMRVRS